MTNYAEKLVKRPFDGEYSAPSVVVTLALGLAYYNSLEMVLLIATTFKKWKGLYFYSLVFCNLGVIGFALGMTLDFWQVTSLVVAKIFVSAGWMTMIAAQSVVLYSRLGLLVEDLRIIQAVKWMILANCSLLLSITTVLDWGTTYSSDYAFTVGYFYIELIQMIGFTLQEVIISGLYVWKTIALLKFSSKTHTRSMAWQILAINIIIICMDIALITMQFRHMQIYQESIKIFVYSVKLKLEINILSKLVDLVHGASTNRSMTLEIIDSNAVQGQAQLDLRREMTRAAESPSSGWYSNDQKGILAMDQLERSPSNEPKPSSSLSVQDPNDNNNYGIARVLSHQSAYTARTSGRESDVLYADFVRSMK